MNQNEIHVGDRLRIAPAPVLAKGLETHLTHPFVRDDIYTRFEKLSGRDFTVKEIIPDGCTHGSRYFYTSEEGVELISVGIRLKIFSWALEPIDDQKDLLPEPDPDGLFSLIMADDRKEPV